MSIAKAQAELHRVNREVMKLETQLTMARDRAMRLEHYIEVATQYEKDGDDAGNAETDDRRPRSNAVSHTIRILEEAGVPLTIHDILQELGKAGIVIGGQNPVTNLSSSLSRSDELENIRGQGWSLTKWNRKSAPPDRQPETSKDQGELDDEMPL